MDFPLDPNRGEGAVRHAVRLAVGEDMTATALRLAMRGMTPDSYRQAVLLDGVSALAVEARLS